MTRPATLPAEPSLGHLLQHWRRARQLSQLELAHRADISARHLCFIETGRSKPSRAMVLLLATSLDVPLRERNALLLAAGFAPVFAESSLDAPQLAKVRSALDAILRQQEPFPAIVLNRNWDIVTGNEAARRFFAYLLDWSERPSTVNVARLMFDPTGLRPRVRNWGAVARSLLQRIRREALGGVGDARAIQLIDELLAYPDVRHMLGEVDPEKPTEPVIPVAYARAQGEPVFHYFSIVSTLGTAQDVTLQELRVESFFPADAATERQAHALATTTPRVTGS
jgi:transcriptional regulator with XRE-family HTH domain